MQDAGWTYEFFDGTLLLHDDVTLADGLVQPDGPGYQALIIYQCELDADTARQLLAWAEHGHKILLVNGARELKSLLAGQHRTTNALLSKPQGSTAATVNSPTRSPPCSPCQR